MGAAHLGSPLASIAEDPIQFDLALATLRNLSLVQRDSETHMFSLHRLVQAVLREQMELAEVQLWSKRVICMVDVAFPPGNFATWTQCERYLAQALACVPPMIVAGKDLPEAGELLSKAGHYLWERGRFRESEPLLTQAVRWENSTTDPTIQHFSPAC